MSVAGNRNGLSGRHSSAFWGFINILRGQGENRPSLVLLENVTGWLTSNNGNDFSLTLKALDDLGYSLDIFHIDAIRFTPQSRPRVFVVGIQIDNPNNDFNMFENRDNSLKTNKLIEVVYQNKNISWHFLDIPTLPPKNKHGLHKIIEDMPEDDDRWWSDKEVKRHIDMMVSSHLKRVQKLKTREKFSYRTIYRRRRNSFQRAEVRHGDTAGCLRTAKGGSSRQIVIKMGKGQVKMRHMTPREYARLQGVPDNYPLTGNVIQNLTGFGDAVCVPVIYWIGENILNPIVELYISNQAPI